MDRAKRWEEESHVLVQTRLQGMPFPASDKVTGNLTTHSVIQLPLPEVHPPGISRIEVPRKEHDTFSTTLAFLASCTTLHLSFTLALDLVPQIGLSRHYTLLPGDLLYFSSRLILMLLYRSTFQVFLFWQFPVFSRS